MPGSVGEIVGCAAILAAAGLLSFGLPAINSEIPPQRLASAADTYGVGLGAVGPAIPVSTANGVPAVTARFEAGGDGPSSGRPPAGLTNTLIRDYSGLLIGVALLVVWLAFHSVDVVQID